MITGRYVITLHGAFAKTILKLDTLPPFFYYELLLQLTIASSAITMECIHSINHSIKCHHYGMYTLIMIYYITEGFYT